MGTGFLTDHYELTMLDTVLASGVADESAVFEGFPRSLPPGRDYGVVAGIGRLPELIDDFAFTEAELGYLEHRGLLSEDALDWLSKFRFSGDMWAYRDGELYFGGSPVVTVEGTFAEGLVLETLVLSVINHDCAIASAGARMHEAARGRLLIEMGSRRTHEEAAVAAARAAYLVGFDSTSNLAAGMKYQIPTAGTAAHALTLAHSDERTAFDHQLKVQGLGTTLLIDTYAIESGLENAIAAAQAAGGVPGAVRIDSGDRARWTRTVRERLDSAGAKETRIVVSGDLDEFSIAELADSPVDGYGVGTTLVTGSGHPTANMVYKLVEAGGRPVGKTSEAKATTPGRKRAYRMLDGTATSGDLYVVGNEPGPDGPSRALQVPVFERGEAVYAFTLAEDRAHHQVARQEIA